MTKLSKDCTMRVARFRKESQTARGNNKLVYCFAAHASEARQRGKNKFSCGKLCAGAKSSALCAGSYYTKCVKVLCKEKLRGGGCTIEKADIFCCFLEGFGNAAPRTLHQKICFFAQQPSFCIIAGGGALSVPPSAEREREKSEYSPAG